MVKAITLFVLLVSAFTLVGQGIQVSFGYPNESCFRRLSIEDIDSNSVLGKSKFTGNDAYYKFRDMGLWNQPAAYRTNGSTETHFNYFAALVPNAFTPINQGAYSMLTEKSKKLISIEIENSWLRKGEGKYNGNNQITYPEFGNKTYFLNQDNPIWVVQTEANYYQQLGERYNYTQLLEKSKEKPIVKFERSILGYLDKNRDWDQEKNYKYTNEYTISFDQNGDANLTYSNGDNPFNKTIDDWKNVWKDSGYLYAKSIDEHTEIPIATKLSFTLEASKKNDTNYRRYRNGWFDVLPKESKDSLISIENDYKIPRACSLKYTGSSVHLTVKEESLVINIPNKVEGIFPLKSFYFTDIKALVGMAHTNVYKYRKGSLIGLTVGSAAAIGISFAMRSVLYQHYLKSPNDRSTAYTWANAFNKAAVLAIIPYTLGVTLDLNKTIKGRKELNNKLRELIH
jgi:hypothetical protein